MNVSLTERCYEVLGPGEPGGLGPAPRRVGHPGEQRARADRRPRAAGRARLALDHDAADGRRPQLRHRSGRWPTEAIELFRVGPAGLGAPKTSSWRPSWRRARADRPGLRAARSRRSCASTGPTPRPSRCVRCVAGQALERIADHAAILGSRLRYLITGDPPPRRRGPADPSGPPMTTRASSHERSPTHLPPGARPDPGRHRPPGGAWSPSASRRAPTCCWPTTCRARSSSSRTTTSSTRSPSTSRSAATRCWPCSSPWPSTCARWSPPSGSTSEIERSGDLMVNVAKGARRIYGVQFDPRLRGLIERMSEEATRLFRLAIDAYVEGNASLAAALDDMDDGLDLLHKDYIQAIFESHHAGVIDLQAAVQLALDRAVLRAHRRPRGEHRRAGRVHGHRAGCPSTRGAARPARPPGAESTPTWRPTTRPRRRPTTALDRWPGVDGGPAPTGRAPAPMAWSPWPIEAAARRDPGRRRWWSPLVAALVVVAQLGPVAAGRAGRAAASSDRGGRGRGRGRAGPGRRDPRCAWPRPSTPSRRACSSPTPTAQVVVRNRVADDVRRRPPQRRAGRGGHRRAARPRRCDGQAGIRTIDLFGPPRRTLVIAADPAAPTAARLRRWSTTSPSGAGSRPPAATSWPTSATSSRRRWGPWACWPRRCWPRTTRQVASRLAERIVNEAFRLDRTIEDLLVLSRIEGEEIAAHEPVAARLWWPRRSSASARRPSRPASTCVDRVERRSGTSTRPRRPPPARVGALQPARQRGEVLRRGRRGRGAGHRRGRRRGARRCRTTASGSPRPTSSGSSSGSTGSTRPAAATTGGTGLGLAIVRHVATNHAGEVRVDSRLGEGSTFSLVVPAAAPAAVAPPDRRTDTASADHRPARGATMSPPRRCSSSRTRTRSSTPSRSGSRARASRCSVARDGAEALDMFDDVQPDLVLLDVMLPKVSGIDVCRELRSRSSVPIIMVTAKGAEIDTVVGLEVGADDYVTKPYRLRELVARMRAVLRRRAERRRAGRSPVLLDEVVEVGDVRRRPRAPRGVHPGRRDPPAAQGVRAAGPAARERRPGAHPRDADRPGVGRRLRRRHQDARRAHQAAAVEGRARPGRADAHRHHPGPRLQVREPRGPEGPTVGRTAAEDRLQAGHLPLRR